jgi:hypothetical protein
MTAIEIYDGNLTFEVTRDGEKSLWEVDLLELKLAAEALEQKHKLAKVGGCYVPTAEFLKELSAAYVALGCPECRPAQAQQVWIVASNKFLQMSKRMAGQVDEALN